MLGPSYHFTADSSPYCLTRRYILAVYDAAIDQLFRKGFQLQRFRQASSDLKRIARRQEELP